ncbi:addiction module toxin YoeB [Planktothricoides sp. SR001]|uniref:Txe/YoeB family addiction module toxin n=1 Tax=Planktothricoides sp. SR001 TaxID=1705388 RepID=UPI0006C1EF8A|nr:Txe/YoeB family addiction module toxin [Planktothricoides sp. SR001]KOR35717.1 addiction module toxin YoeB [Planktothricoides sp. SR001]
MSPKKKKPGNENPNNHISGYFPVFSPDFKADLAWWYRTEPKKGDKILDLVADILDGEPFTGLGKPEPLKYIAADTWSRRIDLEHRLVYKVTGNKVYFLQARYHYQSD